MCKKLCLICSHTYQIEGYWVSFNSYARSLLPILLKSKFSVRIRRYFHNSFSAAKDLPFVALCKKSFALNYSWKKTNCFQMCEQSTETKVKLTIFTHDRIKHNPQSQNTKFSSTENIWWLGLTSHTISQTKRT